MHKDTCNIKEDFAYPKEVIYTSVRYATQIIIIECFQAEPVSLFFASVARNIPASTDISSYLTLTPQ